MTEPTIAELDAQIADLLRQRDLNDLPKLEAVQAMLGSDAMADLLTELEANLPSSPPTILGLVTSARAQVENVIGAVRAASAFIDREVTRAQVLVEPEPAEE